MRTRVLRTRVLPGSRQPADAAVVTAWRTHRQCRMGAGMTTGKRELRRALSRCRETLAACFAEAHGPERVALLRLRDAVDRLLFILASEVPLAATRALQGGAGAVDLRARLADASEEFDAELRTASEHMAPALVADLQRARDELVAILADVLGTTRGGRQGPTARAVAKRGLADSAPVGAMPEIDPASRSAQPEAVSFSASSPAQARPGDEFVARFAAYLSEDEASVRAALAEAAPHARLTVMPKSGGLLRGTEVEIVLEGTGLQIDGAPTRAAKRVVWEGKPQIVEFDVAVPEDAAPRNLVLKFYVRLAGIVLERLSLELEIGDAASATGSGRQDVPVKRLPATAFASYSSLDRPRVLDRVAAIRIAAGIDVFLDCMDLNPSEEWEPRLKREIDARELFILFWSEAASRSRWVTWEWERALEAKGMEAMQIQPLENGVSPPRKLRAVHVADPYVDLRQAELARRAAAH